jgi:di/tricarboxylate transporter
MTLQQTFAFVVIALMMAAFIWGRFRYDVVACCSLLLALALGIVPFDKAFSGFSDDIVIIVASALMVSAAVARSGIVNLAVKRFFPNLASRRSQLALLLVSVAVLSAFIKNIGALAIMMPLAFQFAKKSGTPASKFLMPMAFAALLGGLMTQIGTSPNIVVSRLRQEIGGESFSMFDFTPVGAVLTVCGILFLLLFNRIVPERTNKSANIEEALEAAAYSSDATIEAGSPSVGKSLNEVLRNGDGDVIATAIIRGHVHIAPLPDVRLTAGDTILMEGTAGALDKVVSAAGLTLSGQPIRAGRGEEGEISAIEAVVGKDSRLIDISARSIALFHSYGINLLAVSRQGERLREKLSAVRLRPGDMIVVQGNNRTLPTQLTELGLLPLAQREILLGAPRRAIIPVLILMAAMVATAFGVVPVATGFFAAAVAMVVFRAVPLREAYTALDGPILIMLAALIPVSDSLRTTGASELVAGWLGDIAVHLPPFGALGLILLTAMAVTPFLNNAATVLVMAPIAASFANALHY